MTNFLLKEDGSYLLLEDSFKIILQIEGISPSMSPSVSISLSPSLSLSGSFSLSPSLSLSLSASPSPSAGYSLYTRGDELNLPDDIDDLETLYSDAEETKVSTTNSQLVGQTGTLQYMIHQFKKFVGANTFCEVETVGRTDLPATVSPIYLEVFNHLTNQWENLDTESLAPADIDFVLEGKISDLTDYKDDQNVITCRVYQLAV